MEAYYPALNSFRKDIASFYIPTYAFGGGVMPAIVYNGESIPDAASLQAMFVEKMPPSRYEVQNYDCQVLNENYVAEGAQAANPDRGKNMTILLTVSGFVKYGEAKDTSARGFSESFVLIPNPAAVNGGRNRGSKDWLIQNQNFRIVV